MAERKQSKRVMGIRADDRTRQKIEDLRAIYGTKTTAICLAIDRLWLAEFGELHEGDLTRQRQ